MRLDQQFHETVVLAIARKSIRNVRARELIEYFAAITPEPRVHTQPERRITRKRKDMRQEIARGVHEMNRRFLIFYANVHVQSEDQIGPRYHLQILDDDLIPLVRINILLAPVRERVRTRSRQAKAILARQLHDMRAQ